MIAFNPEITIEIGSTVSIVCSFLGLIGLYYMYRQLRNRVADMATKIEMLAEAFTSLTNVLIGETDESKIDVRSVGDNNSSIDPIIHGLRNSREAKTVPENNAGKDS